MVALLLAPIVLSSLSFSFFFNDTATTEIYTTVHTLSLHDALPISSPPTPTTWPPRCCRPSWRSEEHTSELQSRTVISYAVFCLKKKKKQARVYVSDFSTHKQTTTSNNVNN